MMALPNKSGIGSMMDSCRIIMSEPLCPKLLCLDTSMERLLPSVIRGAVCSNEGTSAMDVKEAAIELIQHFLPSGLGLCVRIEWNAFQIASRFKSRQIGRIFSTICLILVD